VSSDTTTISAPAMSVIGTTGPWHHGPQPCTSMPWKFAFTVGSKRTRYSLKSSMRSRPPFSSWNCTILRAMSPL